MQVVKIDENILVACVTAASFPMGIMAAFQQLHTHFPVGKGKTVYGISYGSANGSIVYKAAININSTEEAAAAGLETFTITAGNYLGLTVNNFMANTAAIGNSFKQLLMQPGIDANGYCLEIYEDNKTVHCLVRLKS